MKDKSLKYEDIDLDIEDLILSKYNNDLFDEEKNIPHNVLMVKRVLLPGAGEDWEITDSNRIVFILRGARLTKKEKSIMRKPEGLKMLIEEYKQGNRSINKIKDKLKKLGKNNDNI